MYDTIIVGAGPAGLSAAIYAKRAELSFIVLEKEYVNGGQIINTSEVDNYPGLYHINGFDLGQAFSEHAAKLSVSFENGDIQEIKRSGEGYEIVCDDKTYETKTIIFAAGTSHRRLGVPGEEEFGGRGVSYCATCDGAFFKGKEVAVVGGGDVAVSDAIYLSRMCSKVYLIHRRDSLRAAAALQKELPELENVELVYDSNVTEVHGDKKVNEIIVSHKSGLSVALPVEGVFIAVGISPQSTLLNGLCDMDEQGYVIADETCKTSNPDIFVAGDIRTKVLRQVVTAVSDGANAVESVCQRLTSSHRQE